MKNSLSGIQIHFWLALLFVLSFSLQSFAQTPELANIEGLALSYKEGDGAVEVTQTITVKDPDDTELESATATIGNYQIGQDVLSFNSIIVGIDYIWDNLNGELYLYGTASVDDYQTLLRSITYENTSNAPSEILRTINFVVNDGDFESNILSRGITVLSVNSAPVLSITTPSSPNYTENGPAVLINSTITIADEDDTFMESATAAITSNYALGQDTLAFVATPGITGTWNPSTGMITFTGHATIARYHTALRSVTYRNNSENPSTATRQISFSVNDGNDKSNTLTFPVTITAVNDIPVLSNMETIPLAFTENDLAVAITTTLSAADPDNTNLTSASVAITGSYQTAEDVLSYSTVNGITGTWNPVTGVLSLSNSATLAQYTAALRTVRYQNVSEDPSILTRTVSFTVNDGAAPSLAATRNIAISAVNDVPVLSGIEIIPLAYTAGAGLKIITDSIQVKDTDNVNLTIATIRITTNYQNGQDFIRFINNYGITGIWTASTGTMALTGPATVANFRSAIRSLKYENTNLLNPSTLARTITFRVNDGTANSNTLLRVVSFVPTATISGGGTICRYQKDTIVLDLTGEPNWTVVMHRAGNSNPLLNKDTTISAITATPYKFLINVPGIYTLVSVKDNNYDAGLVYGTATIALYPSTTAKLTGTAQICQDGSGAPLTVDFTGTSPYTFGLRRNTQDTIYTGITQDPFIINVNKQGIYRITSLSDLYCIGDTLAGYGTATLSYITSPKATISGADTICQGDTAILNVLFEEGTPPFSITYLVNGANAKTVSNITQMDYDLEVKAEGIYTLSAVSDQIRSGCVTGTGTVVYYTAPTAAITGTGAICEHTSTNLRVTLTGAAPWTYSYRRNTVDTTIVTGVASSPDFETVTKAGTYSLVTVSDKFCPGTVSGAAVISVTPAPEVEITGLAPAYSLQAPMIPVFGDPAGGTFTPPVYLVRDTNFFFPNWAGPGMHAIVYTYRDPGTGCYGYDTVNVMVLIADADIMFPEDDTKKLFCYNDSVFTILGNNTANDTGTFRISGGIGLTDKGDNSATIDPSRLNGGTYTVTYRYFNSTYLEIAESFELEKIDSIYFIGFEANTHCQGPVPIRLTGNRIAGVFEGNAVYGNTSSGFYFRSDLTASGPDTVFYTLTGPKGCSRRIFKSLTIYDTPDILFTVSDTCIYTGLYDSTAFINLTSSEDAIKSWKWSFDDINSGAKNTSTLKNPKHRYLEGGRRDIWLEATTSNNCYSKGNISYIFGDKPTAAFSWETECFHAGQKIAFTNKSTFDEGEIKDYLWKFSKGDSYDTYTTKDVDYLFSSPENYNVELFVSTNYGCTDTILKAIHIRPTYSLDQGSSYYESFESGPAGWASSSDELLKLNSWTLGQPVVFMDAGEGINAWYTNITSNQPDAEQSYVTSPCFSFDGIFKPMIKFSMKRLFNGNRDGAILQYSTDNWNTAPSSLGKYALSGNDGINWYNSVDIEGKPGGSVVGWSNIKDNDWNEAKHSLDLLKGKKDVQFRIAYGSDGTAIGTEGLAFDEVWIGERNKMTLIEHFTSTSDAASLLADAQLDAMANASPLDIIDIQYHTSLAGTDPFNQQNQTDPRNRAASYQVTTVPVSILNGGISNKFRFDYDDNELDTNFIKIQALAPSKFSLGVESLPLDNSLHITVDIKSLEALPGRRVTLQIAVIERMISGVTGANGDTFFESVLKIMLPDTVFTHDWDPASGKTWTIQRSWNFKNKTTYDPKELRVIVFLQDEDSREIYQSAISEYDLHTGIGDNNLYISKESAGFIVFPNPASIDFYIRFEEALEKKARADLFDIHGKLVMTLELFPGNTLYEADLQNYPEGFYFLRITSDNQFVGLHKLIISR